MRLAGFALALAVVSAAAAPRPPATKRQAGDAPAIEMADAIARARAHRVANKLDDSRQYLQSAIFNPFERRWTITWQVPNAKGGGTIITVPEAGPVTAGFTE